LRIFWKKLNSLGKATAMYSIRIKLTLLLVVFAYISSIGIKDSAAQSREKPAGTLRVMTYNTLYIFDHGRQKKEGSKVVNSFGPDIVALQELTNTTDEVLKDLATSWNHPHSCLLKTSGFSVGLTSKWPIEVLKKKFKGMHHGFLHVKTNGVHFFVVHLSPFKWAVREREAATILKEVEPLLKKNQKVIVLGDFNAVSQSDKQWLELDDSITKGMKKSDEKHSHVENLKNGKIDYSVMKRFLDAGLVDSTEPFLKKNRAARLTIPTGIWTDKKTAPGKGQRVDFILTSMKLSKNVKNSWIQRHGSVNKVSDHYPVITDFFWNSPKE